MCHYKMRRLNRNKGSKLLTKLKMYIKLNLAKKIIKIGVFQILVKTQPIAKSLPHHKKSTYWKDWKNKESILDQLKTLYKNTLLGTSILLSLVEQYLMFKMWQSTHYLFSFKVWQCQPKPNLFSEMDSTMQSLIIVVIKDYQL